MQSFRMLSLGNSSFWVGCTSGPRSYDFPVALLSIWFPFSSSLTPVPTPSKQLGFSEWIWLGGSWTLKILSGGREAMRSLQARGNNGKKERMEDWGGSFCSMGGQVSPQQGQMFFVRNVCNDRLSLALSQMLTYDESR